MLTRRGLLDNLSVPPPAWLRGVSLPASLGPTLANMASIIGGELLLRLTSFAVVVVIARLYGASALGLYATGLAYAAVAVMFSDNGLSIWAVAEVQRNRMELDKTVSRLYATKTLLFIPLALIVLILAATSYIPAAAWIVGGLVLLRTMLQSYCQLQLSVLKAMDRMRVIGPIQSVHFLFLIIGIAGAYLHSWNFDVLLVWMVAGQTLELLLSGSLLWRSGFRPRSVQGTDCWNLLKSSTPVGLVYGMANAIVRLDVILLSLLLPLDQIGQFAAAHMMIVVAYVAAWLFGSVLLPELTRLGPNPASLQAYVERWGRLLLLTTLPACGLLAWAVSPVLRVLYGTSFSEAGIYATVMLFAVPWILLNALYLNQAIAVQSSRLYLQVYLCALVLTCAFDLSLGLSFGPSGVATAIILREIATVSLFHRFRPQKLIASEAAT